MVGPGRAAARQGREDTLLERGRELGLLDDAMRDALEGEPVLALIEGPAGIGKSRLLAEARDRGTAAAFRVLTARGSDLERELPFGVVRQLFEPVLVDVEARARWLSGSAEAAARVFAPPDETSAAGDVMFGALYGLYWLTANVAAEGPLMLAIDDLHWVDPASLRFIAYLAARLEGVGVLVAGAVRMGEAQVESRVLREIADGPATVSIRPASLSENGVVELVRERLGAAADREFCAACHQATGGNPLLLRELLKALEAEGVPPDAAHLDVLQDIGPRAVSRAVLLRLSRLPADAVAVARAVAVAGDGAALASLAALAELDHARAAEAIRALVAAELLRPEPPLGFLHPLIRDAVYHELPPGERELRHAQAARILSDAGAADDRVAGHLLALPPGGEAWAVDLLRRAAGAAVGRGAAESGVAYLRRALAEPPPAAQRPAVLFELGMAEGLINAPGSAAEHLHAAIETLAEPAERGVAGETLARMLLFSGPPQEAVAVARRVATGLPVELGDLRQALEAIEMYAVSFGAPTAPDHARLAKVRRGLPSAGPGARKLAAIAAWEWALTGGSAAECAALARSALGNGELFSADPALTGTVAASVLILADTEDALEVLDAGVAEAHRRGSLFALGGLDVCRGWMWLQRGELVEAELWLRRAADEAAAGPPERATGSGYAAGFLARLLVERGDLPGAARALAHRGTPQPGSDADSLGRRSELELLLADGSFQRVTELVDEYAERHRRVVAPVWAPWRSLKARALHGLSRDAEAAALLEQELEFARRWGAPGALGRTLRLLGSVLGEDGIGLLGEAVEATEGSPARLEHAEALTALGSTMRRARRPSESRELLRRGFEIADRCGARPLADRAQAELYAAGGRPRRAALTGPDSLTPSERRVADLAAEGRSNREIAQTLYVVPRTVEVHLTSVYRKLGITARAGLPEALSDGPAPTV